MDYAARFAVDPRGPDCFAVVGFEEGGVRKSRENDNLRLVCNLPSGGKLVLWGKPENRRNISRVLDFESSSLVVEVKWCVPSPVHAREYGHTHWVPETATLRVCERSTKCLGTRGRCIGCDNEPCIWWHA